MDIKGLLPWKIYLLVVVVVFAACFTAHESASGGRPLNRFIRRLLGRRDLHQYLAEYSRTMDLPYADEVEECDYRTMTAKTFFNDYVKKNRPCLFKEYGKLQKAYHLWQNETYLVEKAGDEVIYAER